MDVDMSFADQITVLERSYIPVHRTQDEIVNNKAVQVFYALALVPVLGGRLNQRSGTLSWGERTMLAMARAMCIAPRVMMPDEPTEVLMPAAIARVCEAVLRLRDSGMAILLVEQRINALLPVTDCVAFMDHGEVEAEFGIDEVRKKPVSTTPSMSASANRTLQMDTGLTWSGRCNRETEEAFHEPVFTNGSDPGSRDHVGKCP